MRTKTACAKLFRAFVFITTLLFAFVAQAQRQNLLVEATFEGSNPFSSPLSLAGDQYCCSYSLTQSSEHARAGSYSMKIDLRKSDPVVSASKRAEIEVAQGMDDSPTEGERW